MPNYRLALSEWYGTQSIVVFRRIKGAQFILPLQVDVCPKDEISVYVYSRITRMLEINYKRILPRNSMRKRVNALLNTTYIQKTTKRSVARCVNCDIFPDIHHIPNEYIEIFKELIILLYKLGNINKKFYQFTIFGLTQSVTRGV
jgi:hypothetical protein